MKTKYSKGIRFLCNTVLLVVSLFTYSLKAQDAATATKTVIVTVQDKLTNESIPFANVVVFDIKGEQIAVGTTNMEGVTTLLVPDRDDYILRTVYVGYRLASDTLSCSKPRCIRTVTLGLEAYGIMCFPDYKIFDTETEEEIVEAQRFYERAEEELEIREDLNDFVCYPNPAEKYLNILVEGIEATELIIMTVKGDILVQKKITLEEYEFEINLESYPRGLYYVVCRGGGLSSSTKTIIKQ